MGVSCMNNDSWWWISFPKNFWEEKKLGGLFEERSVKHRFEVYSSAEEQIQYLQ